MAVDEVALRWPPAAVNTIAMPPSHSQPLHLGHRSAGFDGACKAATSADRDATNHAPWLFGSGPTCVLL